MGAFLQVYLGDVLKRVDSPTECSPSLVASAVESITLFYIVIDNEMCGKLLELSARIGAALSSLSDTDYSADYRDMVGDCCRKLFNTFLPDQVLSMLEPLSADGLSFLLREARKVAPAKLDELMLTARTAGSFNKVVDTFESQINDP